MLRSACWILWGLMISSLAYGLEHADGAYLPPMASKSLYEASLNSLPKEAVANYLGKVTNVHTFRALEGRNPALKARNDASPVLKVAEGYPVSLASPELFDAPVADGAYQVYLAGITSVDAESVRFLMDLSGLRQDEELWVLDPTGTRAFGPYAMEDNGVAGCWLPTINGDTGVLMVRTPNAGLPAVKVQGISHFYEDMEEIKELPCNINIACEADSAMQQVSSAVGLVLVASGLDTIAGSGTLINVPATQAFEPYFLTANHLLSDPAAARNVDVIWDYRSSQCDANDTPSLSSLPRSRGIALLSTSATLDATLLRLDTVPVGEYGRAYLGWDTRTPTIGKRVVVMHFPGAKHMRITYGTIQQVDQPVASYLHETRAGWDRGVTEPGSSGGCLLHADGTFRLLGTLTGGSSQTCEGTPADNFDYFSSFRKFFEEISPGYLTGANGDPSYRKPSSGGDGKDQVIPGCFATTTAPGSLTGGDLLVVCSVAVMLLLAGRRRAIASRVRERD